MRISRVKNFISIKKISTDVYEVFAIVTTFFTQVVGELSCMTEAFLLLLLLLLYIYILLNYYFNLIIIFPFHQVFEFYFQLP